MHVNIVHPLVNKHAVCLTQALVVHTQAWGREWYHTGTYTHSKPILACMYSHYHALCQHTQVHG